MSDLAGSRALRATASRHRQFPVPAAKIWFLAHKFQEVLR